MPSYILSFSAKSLVPHKIMFLYVEDLYTFYAKVITY